MSGIPVFITAFSEVRLGPKWSEFIRESTLELDQDKRTKMYKFAKQKQKEIECAINIMAEFEWWRGGTLKELP